MSGCQAVMRGPPSDPWEKPCSGPPVYRVETERGERYLCPRCAKLLRHTYEPGQMRKLRKPAAF